ncbi:MAG: NOB1 family endonuclease [Candidatus Hodarchaeota archaeon]
MKEITTICVFDTNIFLTGIDFNVIEGIIYTTSSIVEEVNDDRYKDKNRNIFNKINAAIERKKLKIKIPKKEYIDKIHEVSKRTGDFNALSDADKGLIAISLELLEKKSKQLTLYSNDYSIENVCSELNIPYSSLYKNGIESKIIWEIYCPYCKNIHSAEDLNKICEICGSKLRRRPKN